MAVPEGIQKIVTSYNKIPYSTSDGFYYVRYRVITESKDIFSSWSPKYKIAVVPISSIVGSGYNPNASVISDGDTIRLTWSIPANVDLTTFDIYAKWSTQSQPPSNEEWSVIDWKYVATTQGNNISITIPGDTNQCTISGVTYGATTVTYTTLETHGLKVGDWVTIYETSPQEYNGVYQVTSVNASAKTFTVTRTTTTPITDPTGFVSIKTRYVKFWVQVPTINKATGSAAKLFEIGTQYINQLPSLDGGTP